jgi:hypothetical protein
MNWIQLEHTLVNIDKLVSIKLHDQEIIFYLSQDESFQWKFGSAEVAQKNYDEILKLIGYERTMSSISKLF